jgi:CelD/BcsL family acetyltransferase involved in cellulose biosynthesis
MSAMRLVEIGSLEGWREYATAWDDLWQRSAVRVPTVRSEICTHWAERFARGQPVHAWVVAEGDHFLAGLLVGARRIKRIIEVGATLTNEWCTCGDLLLDPAAPAGPVLDLLVAGLAEAPWSLIWLDDVPVATERWQALLQAIERAGLPACCDPTLSVGQVRIAGDWAAYEASWSSNHRRKIRKATKRARQAGALTLERHSRIEPAEVPRLLARGFAIEDHSWKAGAGSSLRRSGQMGFFEDHARLLAAWGQLELVFLLLDGEPIAFEFGYRAKGTYFSPKVGYDERYASLSPGQLLRHELLRELWAEGQTESVDFWGVWTPAVGCWANRRYSMGRLVLAPRRWSSRAWLTAYRLARRATASRRPPLFEDGDAGDPSSDRVAAVAADRG